MEKRVLVTGAAGFIGFHVARALKARGDRVWGLDHFNDYYDPLLKEARAKALDLPMERRDLNEQKWLEEFLQRENITHVVHLAAQAGVRYAEKNPQSYVHSNLSGFVSLLEALRKVPGVPLVYASSSSVYGLNEKVPFSEEDPVDRPSSFYGATKRSNELIAHSYHHLYGLHCTGLRFFTVYGPWGRPDMAYFSFARAILRDEPITLFDGGVLQRDFTYIDDIVAGTVSALDRVHGCTLYNLGNHTPVRVDTLVRLLEEYLGRRARIQYAAKPAADVAVTYADVEKARRELGFQPTTPLEVGLQKFVEWAQGEGKIFLAG
jgi:UDP-glucuronate 4-epimerase